MRTSTARAILSWSSWSTLWATVGPQVHCLVLPHPRCTRCTGAVHLRTIQTVPARFAQATATEHSGLALAECQIPSA